MTTKRLRRIRYMRAAGYMFWVATGLAATFVPNIDHIVEQGVAHIMGWLLIVGGLLSAVGEIYRRFAFEVAGLYLLNGAIAVFAILITGATVLDGSGQLVMALFTIGVAVLLTARLMDLQRTTKLAVRWGELRAHHR